MAKEITTSSISCWPETLAAIRKLHDKLAPGMSQAAFLAAMEDRTRNSKVDEIEASVFRVIGKGKSGK